MHLYHQLKVVAWKLCDLVDRERQFHLQVYSALQLDAFVETYATLYTGKGKSKQMTKQL